MEQIQEELEKQRKEALERDVITGCRAMWDINIELEQDFHPLEEEVARAYCPK